MDLILNTRSVDAETLRQIHEWGFTGTRCDVLPEDDLPVLAARFFGVPIRPLFLLHDLDEPAIVSVACDILGPSGFRVEFTNEPDLNAPWKEDPRGWADDVCQTAAWARRVGFTGDLISGGISNLNERGFDYLGRALPGLPEDLIIGVHRYPDAACDPLGAYPPARSRHEEIVNLLELVHPRRVMHTEGGFHQAERQIELGFDLPARLTDPEVADRMRYELALWRGFDVIGFTFYQESDGPSPDPIDHYGLRRVDGSVKDAIVAVFQRPAVLP